jgi:hydrogenase/urease accessory protein HupE
MRINNLYLIISGLLLSVSSPVVAHTGGPGTGILDLLIHPLTGMDHLLIMFLAAVGVLGFFHWRRTRKH